MSGPSKWNEDKFAERRGASMAWPLDGIREKHGLAEFSNQALTKKNDPAASQWALDAITDPDVRAQVEKQHMDWEKQNAPTR